jgi:hypothetical protein
MLLNRKQYVKHNNCKSHNFVINSGVAQGGVSSPLYFNVFVNDLSQNIDLTAPQFADDVVVINSIYNDSDIKILQNHLNEVFKYKIENKMILNTEKSVHMRISLKNNINLTQNYQNSCKS